MRSTPYRNPFAPLRKKKIFDEVYDQLISLISSGKLGPGEQRFDVGGFESYFRAFLTFAMEDEKEGKVFRKYARDLLNSLKE